MKAEPGDKITIRVSGKKHETILDEHGVQRFRINRIIADLLDVATEGGKLDLNEIHRRVWQGLYTQEERRELYRLIGYSVCGYAEIFETDTIRNPLWEEK